MVGEAQHMQARSIGRFPWLSRLAFTLRSLFAGSSPAMVPRINLSMQDELYNARKAAQIIAFFAMKQGGRAIEVVKAIKLIYLADRESLRRWGVPLLHEPRASLPQGPVNQTTLDYVNGARSSSDAWSTIIAPRTDNTVSIQPDFVAEDIDEFSRAELDVLEQVWKQHGRFKAFQIVGWTHDPANVPEWVEPQGTIRSTPIALLDILRAVGFPDPEAAIDRIEEQRGIERSFRRFQ